jgi:hypothetical protein
MKKMLFTMILAGLVVCGWAEGREGRESGNAPAPEAASILFVGVKEYNVSSNYYTKDQIAAYFNVPECDVEKQFNELFREAFGEIAGRRNLRVTAADETAETIVSCLTYAYEDGILSSDLAITDPAEYRQALERSGAAYLLVCDQYQVRKEVHPYENFAHIFHYSVFDTTGEKVYDGKYQYAALDLGNTDMLEKQLRKAADRFVKTVL